MKRKKRLPVVPAVVGLGAVALGAIVLAQTDKGRVNIVAASSKPKAVTDSMVTVIPAAERKPLSYYTGGVRSDLFNGPLQEASIKPKTEPVKVAKPEKIDLTPSTPAAVNPFADFAYTGTVNAGGEMIALVENVKTKEGQYLKQGDGFMGGKITDIGERTVTIDVAGKKETLAKSDDFKLTPLDKSAPYLTAAPQQAGAPGAVPGAPGAPGTMPGGMPPWMANMPPDAQKRMQDRINSMTPEQRQKMQDRMQNRAFNGGGGGGGRRNRGGGGGGGFGG